MANSADLPAWITLFFGIYAVAASTGELFRPGSWVRMLGEIERSAAIRYLAGIVVLSLGALIYLANPWNPDDWLAVVITLTGAGAVLEGVLFLAFGEQFMAWSRRLISNAARGWALFAFAFGVAFIAIALLRL